MADVNTILYTIVWCLVLFFLAWPLALFCLSWFVFLQNFEALFLVLFGSDVVYTVNDFLERVVLWPRELGKAIATGSQSFPIPPNEVSSKERVSTSGFEASKILWSIAWLLLNIFVAYPLANFLGWWWVIIMPFESLIEALVDVDAMLEAFVTWPRMLMKATITQYEHFPNPLENRSQSPHGEYRQHEEHGP